MPKPLPNYVRTHRRRLGFSQGELGFLLGTDRTVISRYELRERVPRLDGAFALQVALEMAPQELFPGVYEEIEAQVIVRARQLLKHWPANHRLDQRYVLEQLVARAHLPAYET